MIWIKNYGNDIREEYDDYTCVLFKISKMYKTNLYYNIYVHDDDSSIVLSMGCGTADEIKCDSHIAISSHQTLEYAKVAALQHLDSLMHRSLEVITE